MISVRIILLELKEIIIQRKCAAGEVFEIPSNRLSCIKAIFQLKTMGDLNTDILLYIQKMV